jgi:hypothetical protein
MFMDSGGNEPTHPSGCGYSGTSGLGVQPATPFQGRHLDQSGGAGIEKSDGSRSAAAPQLRFSVRRIEKFAKACEKDVSASLRVGLCSFARFENPPYGWAARRAAWALAAATGEEEIAPMDHHKKAVNKFTRDDDKFFSAVGRFFFEFSQLEAMLRTEVAQKIGLDDRYFNSIMTHDFATLCTIAKTELVRTKYEGEYDEAKEEKLKSLINKCHVLNGDRVAIAHGLIWFEDDGSGKLYHIPKSLKSDHPPKDADYIASKADCVCSLRAELYQPSYCLTDGCAENRLRSMQRQRANPSFSGSGPASTRRSASRIKKFEQSELYSY